MDSAHMIATVHKYVEVFETQNMDLIREMYADDAVVEDPVGTEPHRGIEAICAFYESGMAFNAKLKLTGNPRCAANAVAFPFQVVMEGMAIEVIDVFTFNDDGKVIDMKAYWGPENAL